MNNTTSAETIALFGATGATGRHVLTYSLKQGHRVRALARTPGKVEINDDNLTVIQGDFEDSAALESTVKGAKFVICCAGGPSGKAYPKDMMLAFIQRLWPILEAESSVEVFSFQSVIFAPKPDGSLPLLLKILGPVAAYANGNTEMLKDNTAVTKFMAANKKSSFNTIVTRPGAIKEKPDGPTLVANQDKASLSTITFAKLGAFTVDAMKDRFLYGTYPFVIPKK